MKPQRKTVRAGALDRVLENRDERTRHKLAAVLDAYHERYVVGLEARVFRLETPLWKRVWYRLTGRWL